MNNVVGEELNVHGHASVQRGDRGLRDHVVPLAVRRDRERPLQFCGSVCNERGLYQTAIRSNLTLALGSSFGWYE